MENVVHILGVTAKEMKLRRKMCFDRKQIAKQFAFVGKRRVPAAKTALEAQAVAVEALQALAALQAEALRPHQRSNTLATGKHTRPNAKMGDPLNLLCDST